VESSPPERRTIALFFFYFIICNQFKPRDYSGAINGPALHPKVSCVTVIENEH